jgi:hypothetical protein
MSKNMGSVDRTLRLLAAAGIVALYVTQQITGAIAVLLGMVAVLFVGTSISGYCPLYVPMGLSTHKHVEVPTPHA